MPGRSWRPDALPPAGAGPQSARPPGATGRVVLTRPYTYSCPQVGCSADRGGEADGGVVDRAALELGAVHVTGGDDQMGGGHVGRHLGEVSPIEQSRPGGGLVGGAEVLGGDAGPIGQGHRARSPGRGGKSPKEPGQTLSPIVGLSTGSSVIENATKALPGPDGATSWGD